MTRPGTIASARSRTLLVLASVLIAVTLFADTSPDSATAAGVEPQQKREIVELRDAASKTYDLGEGRREWVGYSEAVHYRDSSGHYQEIDNTVVPQGTQIDGVDYELRNGANEYTARFAAKTVETGLVRLDYRGKSISFGPVKAQASDVAVTADVASEMLRKMTYGQSLVAYPEIYPGVDLFYEVKSAGLKEYLVLQGPAVQNEFTFNLALPGLTAKETGERIGFLDEQGEEVFWVGELFAVDNAGVSSNAVSCTLVEDAGAYQLKVSVDKAYLTSAERSYPVVVDPTVMISSSLTADSFVSSLYPTSNYYTQSYLRTGYYTDYGTRRTYIKFDLSGLSGVYADNVTGAWVRIEKYGGGGTPQVAGYRVTQSWSSSTINWNNKPGYSTASADHSDYAYNDSGSWWRMNNLTVLVRNWLRGTYSNYGLCIKDHYEDGSRWTHFYSSDASSPHKPELHIQYIYCGIRPYETENRTTVNCAGYALNLDSKLSFGVNIYDMNDYTESQMLTYTYNKVNAFLDYVIPQHEHISGYQSNVSSTYNRVVMRVGFLDDNGNGTFQPDQELYDFHFWYQTKTGRWAEKHGEMPSQDAPALNAWSNPIDYSWNLGPYYGFYDSDAKYFGEWYSGF
ncbi:MAG: DNRLRE domain-containing protein [Thermoleophilia bacterium]